MGKTSKRNFKKLLKKVVKKSFPELQFLPVVYFVKKDDFFMACSQIPLVKISFLAVDKQALKMNKSAITGCLVHELCHLINFSETNERVIDQMVIERGYIKELLEFIKYHDKRYKKYKKKDGLTKKELKRLLKKNTQRQ